MRNRLFLKKFIIFVFVFSVLMFQLIGCKEREEVTPVNVVQNEPEEIEVEEIVVEDDLEEEETEVPPIVISTESPETLKEITGEEDLDPVTDNTGTVVTEDGKPVVDLIIFMGQSNMSGVGGNPDLAPKVPEGHGYEFKAISDPTMLYPIVEPFGKNESFIGAICDFPGSKRGSLVSSFACKYYKETGVPIVAVSASEGATTTERWLTESYQNDLSNRYNKALTWLDDNGYKVRKRFAIWLQGESDAANNVTAAEYASNMDNIIRPLFIGGLNKVFIITPGRTLTLKHYFDVIVDCQLEMCKTSGYYALGTNVLSGMSAEYMTDEWHYNQNVLNLLGEQCAESVAFYVNNQKEMCTYDYKHGSTYIPDLFEYNGDEEVTPLDLKNPAELLEFKPE